MTEVTIEIPAIQRYSVDGVDQWSKEQGKDGSWVRYEYHVAAVILMQSEIEELEEQIAELNQNLRDAKLDAKDLQKKLSK